MLDWMSSGQGPGPGALDLVTPLAEGQKLGLQERYRQDQIKMDAAHNAIAKQQLGITQQQLGITQAHNIAEEGLEGTRNSIEQKGQDIAQQQWQSEQALRDAQMQIALSRKQIAANEAETSAMHLGFVKQDQVNAMANIKARAEHAATNDVRGALNYQSLPVVTKEGQDMQDEGLSSLGTPEFNSSLSLAKIGQQTTIGPDSYFNPDGSLQVQKYTGALNDYKVAQEKAASEASAENISAGTRAQAYTAVGTAKAQASLTKEQIASATANFKTEYGKSLTDTDKNAALQRYQAALSGSTTSPPFTAQPGSAATPATNTPAGNAFLKGQGVDVTPEGAAGG